jgi:hypothetical protein
MRPGLVFVGLFAILIAIYALLLDSLGALGTFLLQASLILVVLAAATWFRYTKHRKGGPFFGADEGGDSQNFSAASNDGDSTNDSRKAG